MNFLQNDDLLVVLFVFVFQKCVLDALIIFLVHAFYNFYLKLVHYKILKRLGGQQITNQINSKFKI